MERTYDFIAIGGGNAGLTATAKVRASGLKVALVDRGPIGGLCSLNGCNPKKVFVRSAEVLDEARRASEYGILTGNVSVDWAAVLARKRSFTDPVTENSLRALAQKQIDFLPGTARFVAEDQLAIGDDVVSAKGILIATGSTPRPLDFSGAELVRTSDDILATASVPKRLVILGAGVVGMEFAHVFARMGSSVTVLEPTAAALAALDQELVGELLRLSRALGISFHFGVRISAVSRQEDGLRVHYDADGTTQTAAADFVLNAAGRLPALAALDLERGAVEWSPKGVRVSDFLRSVSNPRVFAAGDAHGRLQLSPVASYEGAVAARNFLEGDTQAADYSAVPSVVFTIPPLASVGLTEEQARERGIRVRVTNSDMSGWKVYAIAGEKPARAKVVVDEQTGKIVGAHLLGAGAAEIIHLYAFAMHFAVGAEDLRSLAYAYPTLSSAVPYTL